MSNGKNAGSNGPQDPAAIEKVIEKIGRTVRELRTADVSGIQDRWDARLEGWRKKVNACLAEGLGFSSDEYKKQEVPALDSELDSTFGDRYTLAEFHDILKLALHQAANKLETVGKQLATRQDNAAKGKAGVAAAPSPTPAATPAPTPAP
ncbi:MAG TPA: hypothetical protein VHL79_17785, partial [Ramlibacter sp.]|nr:hypothetical protein [Ramlibacter sp.]